MENNYKVLADNYYQDILIVFKSLLVGFAAAGVVVLYRITLSNAEQLAFNMYAFLRNNLLFLPVAAILLCLAGYFYLLHNKIGQSCN